MSSIWLTAPTMTTNDRDGEYYYLFLKGSDIFQEVSFALLGGVRMSNDKAITRATTTTNDRDGEYYYLFLKGFDIVQVVSFALLRGVCMSNDKAITTANLWKSVLLDRIWKPRTYEYSSKEFKKAHVDTMDE
jgi:hypothetical protein